MLYDINVIEKMCFLFDKQDRSIKVTFFLLFTYIILYLIPVYFGNFSYSFGISQILNFKDNYRQTTIPVQTFQSNFNSHGMQKINEPITQVDMTNPLCTGQDLNDNFDFKYNLKDGQTSPNGKWKNIYSGFGSTGVEEVNGSNVFFLKPTISKSSKETEAALVKSTISFCDFKADFDTKTVTQLRENSPPNTWEAGWFIFRYTDKFHYYWFLIRSDGIELGKKDCDTCSNSVEGQQFLFTKDYPTLQLDKWTHWKIIMNGNHIQIFADGTQVVNYTDDDMNPQISAGAIAMYTEDAYVRFDNMNIKSR